MHLLIVIGTRPNFIKVTRFRKVMDAIPDTPGYGRVLPNLQLSVNYGF